MTHNNDRHPAVAGAPPAIIEDLSGQRPHMGNSRPSRSALLAASADADPVTRLVLGWLAGQRSESTRAAYARDIGITPRRRPSRAPSWLAWCQEQGVHPVTGATGLHVARYARELDLAELSPASAARKLAAVSSWYAWLARRGHITASPAVGIARPRAGPDTSARPVLTREQVLALVHAADTARGPQRARTAALLAVLGADVEDLGTDRGHRVLWVTRKNGRRLGLTLPGLAAARIDAYLAGRAEDKRVPVLFATGTGGRLFAADVWRIVRRLAAQAGLPIDLAAHLGPSAMRRSFAALYLDSGGALHGLQSARGHADPRTTRRYERGRPARGHSPRPASAAARGGPCTLGPAARPGASGAETAARRFPR